MKINGLTPVYFDIETTGFSAWGDEFICAADYTDDYYKDEPGIIANLDGVIHLFRADKYNPFENYLIVTWNGENYRGGFDFPFIRSKCIQEGIEWEMSGARHLDLLPLVRKYLNTTGYEPPKKSDLYADDLKRLAEANGIDYSNKSHTYEELEQMDNVDWLDYEMQPNEDNSLQAVYQMMFDPEKDEEYIDGERIPELYEEMKDKEIYNGGQWEKIKGHNRRDVERLKKVAEKVIPVLPDWEIKRNINQL